MLFIFLSIILVIIAVFGAGSFGTSLCKEPCAWRTDDKLLLGFFFIAAVTEMLSLLFAISVVLRVILLLFWFGAGVFYVWQERTALVDSKLLYAAAAGYAALLSFKMMDTQLLWDTRLYHLLSIRYLHETSVVPGLANLDMRMGFNAQFLSFATLFDFGGNSPLFINAVVYTLAFVLLLLAWKRYQETAHPEAVFVMVSLALLLADLQYLKSLYQEPFAWLAATWLIGRALESDKEDALQRMPLLLAATLALTLVKRNLVWVTLLLLPVLTWNMLRSERRWKVVLKSVLPVSFLCLPNLVRSVIVSGYPFFPLPYFSFPFDWAVPRTMVENMLIVIRIFSRTGYRDLLEEVSFPVATWLPMWFELYRSELILQAGTWLLVVVFFLLLMRKKTLRTPTLILLMAGFLVFPVLALYSSAQLRFSMYWFGLMGAASIMMFVMLLRQPAQRFRTAGMLFVLSLGAVAYGWKHNTALNRPQALSLYSSWLTAPLHLDTPDVPASTWQLADSNTVFIPRIGEFVYYNFPIPAATRIDTSAFRFMNSGPVFRGRSWKDGFRTGEPEAIKLLQKPEHAR